MVSPPFTISGMAWSECRCSATAPSMETSQRCRVRTVPRNGVRKSFCTKLPASLLFSLRNCFPLTLSAGIISLNNGMKGLSPLPWDFRSALEIVAAGVLFLTCAPNKCSAGRVFAWGSNTNGETNVPPGLTNVVSLAGGSYHCLALRADGTVVAWGLNTYGQTNVPPDLINPSEISAGEDHSLALQQDGSIKMW